MRVILSVTLAIVLATSLAAQATLDWSDLYDHGHWAHAGNVGTDSAGNVYVAGSGSSGATADSDAILRKYSPTGTLLWTRTHNTGQGDTNLAWRGFAVDAAGNSLIAGNTYVFPGGGGPPTVYAFVRRYDTSGALTLDLSFSEEVPVCIYGPGGEIYVGAYDNVYAYSTSGTLLWTNSFTTVAEGVGQLVLSGTNLYAFNSTASGETLRAINATTGATVWSTDLVNNQGWISNLAVDGTGNVYASGSFLDPNPPHGQGVMLAKLTSSGVQDWITHRNPASSYSGGWDIVVTASGAFVAGGNHVTHFDTSGTFQWEFTAATGTLQCSALQLQGGRLIYAGQHWNGTTPAQARLGALDSSGTELWHVDLTTTLPGEFHGLVVVGDKAIAVGETLDSMTGAGDMVVAQNTLPAPQLEVSRTGSGVVADGGNDPIAVSTQGVQLDLMYSLENVGNATLTFGATAVTALATSGSPTVVIAAAPAGSSTLASAITTDIELEITPTAIGPWTVTVTIQNDGSTGGSHVFTITGDATAAPAPLLQVQRNHPGGTSTLADGDTETVFGTVDGVTTTLTYDLTNIGNALLTFGTTSVTITPGAGSPTVALVGAPAGSSTLSASGTIDFDVQITPASASAWTATLDIHSDGTTGGTHTITLSGTAQATQAPLIRVLRGTTTIASGGSDSLAANTLNVTYTIRNEGSAVLNLTAVPIVAVANESNCTATITQPTSSVVAWGGGTVDFTVQVSALTTGAFSFELFIAHDAAGSPYEITVNGNTTAAPAGDDKREDSGCSTSDGASRHLITFLALLGLWLYLRSRRVTPSLHV